MEAERLYREGWDAARRHFSGNDLHEIADMLFEGTFDWRDFFDAPPAPAFLSGFKDSAWRFANDR